MPSLRCLGRLGCVTFTVWMGAAACKKPSPPPPDPPATDVSASGGGAASAEPPVAPPDPAAPDGKLEKSEELRFIEGNAELVCFEREKKRTPKDKERSDILKAHGFTGKAAEQRFTELSIRGDKDREWGRRTAERIKQETTTLCPGGKK